MHLIGLMGMPRRVYTYSAELGVGGYNLLISVGAFLFAAGILLLLINIIRSRTAGAVAGPNPWDAPTLEWSVSSPPPPYNFAVIPVIASRHPLWEDRLNETTDRSTSAAVSCLIKARKLSASPFWTQSPTSSSKCLETACCRCWRRSA